VNRNREKLGAFKDQLKEISSRKQTPKAQNMEGFKEFSDKKMSKIHQNSPFS